MISKNRGDFFFIALSIMVSLYPAATTARSHESATTAKREARLSKLSFASQESSDRLIGELIEQNVQTFQDGEVQNSIFILDLENNQIVYTKDAERLLNPASNTKVLTSLAALIGLGPNFQFKTQLLGSGDAKKGHLATLTLKGYGDPTFSTSDLEAMVLELKQKGVNQIDHILLDDSFFEPGDFPGRFDGRQKNAYFNATIGALSINHNILEVSVSPGKKVGDPALVELIPYLPGFPFENEATTGGKGGRIIVRNLPQYQEDIGVSVRGSIPLKSEAKLYRLNTDHPTRVAGMRLIQALRQRGIQTPETAEIGTANPKDKIWVEHLSLPLAQILQELNKNSDNFIAEQITLALGAQSNGTPTNTEKGVRAIAQQLLFLGVELKGVTLENGSGLSKLNRISAKCLAETLQKAYNNKRLKTDFLSSLSILGVDGTLRKKFRHSELEGMFVGKTGTLNGVTSLSGYAFRKSDSQKAPFAFAFIANGTGKGIGLQKQLQGKLLEILINQ